MTVASGRGWDVADVGRKRPVAVFCKDTGMSLDETRRRCIRTYCLSLEPLDEDAVEERDEGLDGLECCGGL